MNENFGNLIQMTVYAMNRLNFKPETAIVLGSGLGDFADTIDVKNVLDFAEIPGFPVTTNKNHKGKFVCGKIEDKDVIIMQGRIHYYEGYKMEQVVMPIRLMKLLGAKNIILTNASGGISDKLEKGDLMMITDHISSFVPSSLIGGNIDEIGERFPDMTHVYNEEMQQIIRNSADKLNIEIKEGVYLQTTGPNYETPAEIKMYKLLGADAVGMSTACEAMAAHHAGMKVCGISCITNKAAGIEDVALNDEDVKDVAKTVAEDFKKLLREIVVNI